MCYLSFVFNIDWRQLRHAEYFAILTNRLLSRSHWLKRAACQLETRAQRGKLRAVTWQEIYLLFAIRFYLLSSILFTALKSLCRHDQYFI